MQRPPAVVFQIGADAVKAVLSLFIVRFSNTIGGGIRRRTLVQYESSADNVAHRRQLIRCQLISHRLAKRERIVG